MARQETSNVRTSRQWAREQMRSTRRRDRLVSAIDRLIEALDALDAIDPDLEDSADAEDGADSEPLLGSVAMSPDESQEGWSRGYALDDDEPSLGWDGVAQGCPTAAPSGYDTDVELDTADDEDSGPEKDDGEDGICDLDGLEEQFARHPAMYSRWVE